MKNLKLTNLEKMNQEEMAQLRGGVRNWYVYCKKPENYQGSACCCAGRCTSHTNGEGKTVTNRAKHGSAVSKRNSVH